ncbi:hypothetical protein PsorP6_013132 [Peronosclerospora sorghi]|uniref:Uncharacterized protein n=1 Tax=Peronosclerospora sorghi TaxID=230839 RepID=A0ACC0WGN6_9STRA|nr:hypothetical protein PsorP6_013132 [Peronosclerospora sorghi]
MKEKATTIVNQLWKILRTMVLEHFQPCYESWTRARQTNLAKLNLGPLCDPNLPISAPLRQ